ncbi:MAG TPA: type II toxin-antitoxin system prevent-host-death family antitoxin [Candidatus Acidoferrales bacterium]|nr:type II toxin-antitoxin system prevent-host-death family antitoxin [Candidatus Acidoferrales bacterium]
MTNVGIAEFKTHLSEYVRAAQKGKEIIIKDRDTPVAKLVPIDDARPALPKIIRATRSWAEFERMLDAAPDPPQIPADAIDRAIEETRKDVYD